MNDRSPTGVLEVPDSTARVTVPTSAWQVAGSGSLDRRAAAWARAFFTSPNRVATTFWAAGAVAIVSTLPLQGWSTRSLLALAAVAGVCTLVCAVRLALDRRLSRRMLHVDTGVAMVLASLLSAIGPTNHVDFAYLYVWVALFAALYFRPPVALTHVAGIGASYAVVLLVGPPIADPVAAWLALFGTTSMAAAVAMGLTSVLRDTVRTDQLTGLANRRMWDERLEAEMARSARSGAALSVVVADLDGFKAVNDASGHQAGDRLLQDLARAWREAVRGGGDFLARLGGDEFGLLAPGSDELGARVLAKRLARSLPRGVAASVGVATWDRTEAGSELVRRADQAMYRDKRRHRCDAEPTSS